MKTITSARSLRGNTRLVSGQVKIGDVCAAKGLFGIPCSHELVAADPRHLTGMFTTLCTDHLPHVEEDIDRLWEDGHAFGYPPENERTTTADGVEENYRRRNIERDAVPAEVESVFNNKGPGKKKKTPSTKGVDPEIAKSVLDRIMKKAE